MKPAICRMVQVLVDPAMNNGSDTAPAMICRVWSDTCVNLRVFYDGAAVDWVTSATLHPDEQTAREHIVQGATGQRGHTAFWPPRV